MKRTSWKSVLAVVVVVLLLILLVFSRLPG